MAKVGRPLKFKTKEELQEKIDNYFQECRNHTKEVVVAGKLTNVKDPQVPTIAGLAYSLEVHRETIYSYAEKDQFSDTIKKARDYILMCMENKMANVDGKIAGTIFLAKNYGYTDSQKIEHSGSFKTDIDEERINEKIDDLLELRKNDIWIDK
jgi:hypothetical protein